MKKPRDVWETTDGRLHRDKAVAKKHEAWLGLRELCRVTLDELGCLQNLDATIVDDFTREVLRRGADLARILRAKPERAE